MPTERPSYTEQIAQYFREHPGEWINAYTLQRIGGTMAWRTRVSDCRVLKGMTIENRIYREVSGEISSEYRYVPPASESTPDKHDANTFTLRAEAGRLGV